MKKGMISDPVDEEDDAGSDIQDPVLQAAETKVEQGLIPEVRANYHKIVVAGMALAMEHGDQGILYSLKNSKNPIHDCAKGAVNLVLILRRQAKGVMPLKAMVPAGMTLMIKALDFVDKSKIMPIDNATLVKATHIFTNEMFGAFKISPQMLHHAADKVHGMTQDPATMDKMRKASGITPVASPQPTISPSQPPSLINSGVQ